MEKGLDKLETKIDKLDEKFDDFATSKVDKDMFKWVMGFLILVLLSFSGILLSQSLDINSIKTVLQFSEIDEKN